MEYNGDATEELRKAAGDFKIKSYYHKANEVFQVDNIRQFIERGANPNITLGGDYNLSLLQEICSSEFLKHDISIPTFKYLLSLPDINTDHMDEKGRRLIHHTASAPHEEFLLSFFRMKKEAASRYINWYCEQDTEGKIPKPLYQLQTPLFIEIKKYTSLNSISPLLEHGANPNQKCMDGKTPLHVFCEKLMNYGPALEDEKIFNLLLDHGGDIYATDDEGESPLSLVAEMKKGQKLFAILIQRGVDMSILNKGRISLNNRRLLLYYKCDAFNSVLHPRMGVNSTFGNISPDIIQQIRELALRE